MSQVNAVTAVALLVAARIEEEARVHHECWLQTLELHPPYWSKERFHAAREMADRIRRGQKVPPHWQYRDGIRGLVIMACQELRLSHEETDAIIASICLGEEDGALEARRRSV